MARGSSRSTRGTMGIKTVTLRPSTGKALPAKNGGSGKVSTSLGPWLGGGRSKPGV